MFKPNTKTKFVDGDGNESTVEAMTISDASPAAGVFVITQHVRRDPTIPPGYGITHILSGGALLGQKLTGTPAEAEALVCRFWRALDRAGKNVWSTESDPRVLTEATNAAAVRVVRQ